jgi:hypothetical protein
MFEGVWSREAVFGACEPTADGNETSSKRELECAWKVGYEAALKLLW